MGRNYTRVKGGYNPGEWAYKRRKNDGCLTSIILMIGLFTSIVLLF
jgi:hypothetical protein